MISTWAQAHVPIILKTINWVNETYEHLITSCSLLTVIPKLNFYVLTEYSEAAQSCSKTAKFTENAYLEVNLRTTTKKIKYSFYLTTCFSMPAYKRLITQIVHRAQKSSQKRLEQDKKKRTDSRYRVPHEKNPSNLLNFLTEDM